MKEKLQGRASSSRHPRLTIHRSLLRVLFAASVAACAGRVAPAQVWTGPAATPPPKAKETPRAKPQPKPASRPRRARQQTAARVAPLTLQYRVMKVEPNGTQVEVNPITVFSPGDRFRFGFKATEDGYLYVIRQRAPDQPGRVLYPDARVNGGQHFVRKNQEHSVPSDCGRDTPAWVCAFPVEAGGAQDFYTIVFSRDARLNLPEGDAPPGGGVASRSLARHWAASRQRLSTRQRGDTIFSLRVSNLNTRDDELIIRFLINKRQKD